MQELNTLPMIKYLCEIIEYSCMPLSEFSDEDSDDEADDAVHTLDGASLQLRGKVMQVIKKLVALLTANKNLIQGTV